jgi:hypothetical protein
VSKTEGWMAKKRGRIIQFAKFREPHRADEDVRTSKEERGQRPLRNSHNEAAERRAAASQLDF